VCLKVFTAIRNAAYSDLRSLAHQPEKAVGTVMRNYGSITLLSAPLGALPVLRGIAAVVSLPGGEAGKPGPTGDRSHSLCGECQNQRDDLIAFLWQDHVAVRHFHGASQRGCHPVVSSGSDFGWRSFRRE
jgi:hypothetical protein